MWGAAPPPPQRKPNNQHTYVYMYVKERKSVDGVSERVCRMATAIVRARERDSEGEGARQGARVRAREQDSVREGAIQCAREK